MILDRINRVLCDHEGEVRYPMEAKQIMALLTHTATGPVSACSGQGQEKGNDA